MSWPQVSINQINARQGDVDEIERRVLFVGYGEKNVPKTLSVNTQTDFDVVLGSQESLLKHQLMAAMANGGQNWQAFVSVMPMDAPEEEWCKRVLAAQVECSVEGVVVALDISTKTAIQAAAALRQTLLAKYGRWVWFLLAVQGLQEGETWTDYQARLAALQEGIAAPAVQLVPRLWGNEPGVLAGRLCHRSVTVADSPARVKTGALVNLGKDSMPNDSTQHPLDLATLQALEAQRFSVPLWYPDYDGFYWSEGRTLDVQGGDFQCIEHLRLADKIARRVRLLAIAKIADRTLNSTPSGIAAAKMYFTRPLREMSVSSQINGVRFPGEIKSPKDDDISIVWRTPSQVDIYLVFRPVECPKQISISLLLDTHIEQEAA